MCDEKKVISVDASKQGILINGMIQYRNDLISKDKPVEDVNEVITKIINASPKRGKRRFNREGR